MSQSLYVRARLSLAVAAQDAADLSRGVVGDVSTPMRPGERIRKARRVRLLSLSVVDRAVLAELSEGASWDTIADALGIDAEEAERRYAPTWRQWLEGDTDDDQDVTMTAAALDEWWRRHADPWEKGETIDRELPRPVSQVLENQA